MDSGLLALADRQYVLLTTFRRTGAAVSTPVWVARDGDELLITTAAHSGKVKRLRHTPRVTLTPCDMRGRMVEGSAAVEATAVVHDDDETRDRIERALARKYGATFKAIRGAQKLARVKNTSVTLVVR